MNFNEILSSGARAGPGYAGSVDAKTAVALAEAAIPVLGGLYAALMGFRVVGCKAGDPKYEAWHAKIGRHLKWLGPAVMGFGVLFFFLSRR